MKAPAFAYACPTTLQDALRLLATHGEGAKLLAGGQSLMAGLNMRLSQPDLLIDINRIDGLDALREADGLLSIGALTRHRTLESSPLIARNAPLLALAVPHIAHAAIRNRGTIGGSLAYADPAAELPACVTALGAQMVVAGPRGTRRIAAQSFFLGLYSTALDPDEIVTAVEVPTAASEERFDFMELARRGGDYAIVGLAARLFRHGGRFSGVRFVFFGAGDRPALARGACGILEGEPDSPAVRAAAAAALADDLDPFDDVQASAEMRVHLAKVLLGRSLARLAS